MEAGPSGWTFQEGQDIDNKSKNLTLKMLINYLLINK